MAALIVDAGPLYAYVDADDAHHAAALELLETHAGPLIVPTLVITEVVYLLATRLGTGPEVRFLGDLAGGSFTVEPVAAADWLRIAELVARYRDLPLGTVDASVVVTAERLGVSEIATVDRRHFTVVRPAHVDAFTLLP
ncbi:PIN domain-containing protein [Occultella glacieicola]|uniref:Ribonuclease VapC n=1 Tax=Occultella glacieicola TaxID=2518684 RepID=A0ABY2E8E2_9MICO|nr:PIN domain-containing protein [Occultella glacieicola]